MRVFLDWLEPGKLPIYDRELDGLAFVLTAEPEGRYITRDRWARSGVRFILSVCSEIVLDDLAEYLHDRFVELQELFEAHFPDVQGPLDGGGTLFFPCRGVSNFGRGQEALFGLGWMEGHCGRGEETDDPTDYLLTLLRDPFAQRRREEITMLETIDAGWDSVFATQKARELLLSYLNDIQRAQFEKKGEFTVRSPWGTRFLIMAAGHLNIYRLGPGDKRLARYCVVVDAHVPVYDTMLAQKLLIETDPIKFHETANVFRMDVWNAAREQLQGDRRD
jgi:hypothetical protein